MYPMRKVIGITHSIIYTIKKSSFDVLHIITKHKQGQFGGDVGARTLDLCDVNTAL